MVRESRAINPHMAAAFKECCNILYPSIGTATMTTEKILMKPNKVEAKWISDLLLPAFSRSPVKNNREEKPPAGKKTLTTLRFK